MRSWLKIPSVLMAAGSLWFAAAPVKAQSVNDQRRDLLEFRSFYRAPDVRCYPSMADYVRSVEGTPCGRDCTRAAQLRAMYCYPPANFR